MHSIAVAQAANRSMLVLRGRISKINPRTLRLIAPARILDTACSAETSLGPISKGFAIAMV